VQTGSDVVLPSLIPRRLARSRTRIRAFLIAFGRSNSDTSNSMRPASIFERSRISLMRERRCRPDSRMSCRYSVCFSLMSPNIFYAVPPQTHRVRRAQHEEGFPISLRTIARTMLGLAAVGLSASRSAQVRPCSGPTNYA
jgi:hypothetical protein